MSLKGRRPRTSTLVLTGLFLAVLALYLWVRPNPVDTQTAGPGTASTTTHEPTHTPSPTPTHRPTSHSPTPAPTSPSPSPAVSGPSPSPSVVSPAPSDSASAEPSGTPAQP